MLSRPSLGVELADSLEAMLPKARTGPEAGPRPHQAAENRYEQDIDTTMGTPRPSRRRASRIRHRIQIYIYTHLHENIISFISTTTKTAFDRVPCATNACARTTCRCAGTTVTIISDTS